MAITIHYGGEHRKGDRLIILCYLCTEFFMVYPTLPYQIVTLDTKNIYLISIFR
ncbi:hypothetical protein NWP22_06450 [Anabaenopsis tanganyikae CS-531]|uniref:Transposase n=1 Tax=Anabaenopsis tanganyikae CS-531 TaxID=2785304 RepID=A0ABT6KCM8_9CYAN|nr:MULTISPECIES: hypothetical protein [Anabaenopsis]MDH6099912.1 hypothetical protein [Anabaenopsis sp. FSS-46]MDH6105511.1 hypothetical protein [Anabaenopsis tanganyikae CS-531]